MKRIDGAILRMFASNFAAISQARVNRRDGVMRRDFVSSHVHIINTHIHGSGSKAEEGVSKTKQLSSIHVTRSVRVATNTHYTRNRYYWGERERAPPVELNVPPVYIYICMYVLVPG